MFSKTFFFMDESMDDTMQQQSNLMTIDMSMSDDDDVTMSNLMMIDMSMSDDDDDVSMGKLPLPTPLLKQNQQVVGVSENAEDDSTVADQMPTPPNIRRLMSTTHTTKNKLMHARILFVQYAQDHVDTPIENAFGSDCTKDIQACLKQMARDVKAKLKWKNVPRKFAGHTRLETEPSSELPPPPRIIIGKSARLCLSRRQATLTLKCVQLFLSCRSQ